MASIENKYLRYRNLIKKVKNWPSYLLGKAFGFKGGFDFQLREFGHIYVPREMHSPFKENFIDEIYFRYIPQEILSHTKTPTIVDIGANAGFFSLSAFEKFPQATIHAFEPHPYCFKVLEAYKSEYKAFNWQLYNEAASSVNGELTLNTIGVDRFTTMSNVVGKEKLETFTVSSKTLDNFVQEKGIETIDFAKLDCEGAEYEILYTLSRKRLHAIKALCVEAHLGVESNHNVKALHTYLKDEGFTMHMINHRKEAPGYIWAWRA